MKPNHFSDAIRLTLDYYERHAQEFVGRTANLDMSHVYEPFLAMVPQDGHILDAGCGSGRDSAEFVRRGYRVTAFDGSPAMVKAATGRTGLAVLHRTFDAISWREEFDGVWAFASLLHLPRQTIADALVRLTTALKPGGVLFASLKAGTYEGERDGRWFTDTTPDALRALLDDIPGLRTVRIWETDDARPERAGTRWVNALARRGSV
jgi:SAM-dependent methyltransferase